MDTYHSLPSEQTDFGCSLFILCSCLPDGHPHLAKNFIIVITIMIIFIMSAKEVMFSSALAFCFFVVNRITQKLSYSTSFHKMWWKVGTLATEETISLGHFPLRIALG